MDLTVRFSKSVTFPFRNTYQRISETFVFNTFPSLVELNRNIRAVKKSIKQEEEVNVESPGYISWIGALSSRFVL